MKTRTFATLSLSALMLGGTMVGCGMQGQGIASAGSAAHGDAAAEADAARAALAGRKNGAAVSHAEAAVAIASTNPTYRALLGQTYLAAGRFSSARQAFADAHQLDPRDMRFALSLALAQTASGDWAGARQTLAANPTIPTADRGLALALAGDPDGAVAILLPAAREPGATAKTRQNLALAFALSGHWIEARALAALDVAPDQLDKRMGEWAAFAQPKRKSDQVASLLGVRVNSDPGFPMALALNAAVAPSGAAEIVSASPVKGAMPAAPATAAPAATPAAAPASVSPRAPAIAGVSFAARSEVAQALPTPTAGAAPLIAAPQGPARRALNVAAPTRQRLSDGNFYVQLGAYDSPGVARDAWGRIKRRYAGLFADHSPNSAPFALGASRYYRLSVGGFARQDAARVCGQYRAHGGRCFVRAGAGDAVAQWVRPTGIKLASR